jgi:putative dimethyl sulfoxide reductase chaperone
VIDVSELAEVASRRSVLYWTLSELFLTCPDTTFMERLRKVLHPVPCSGYSKQVMKHLRAMRHALPQDTPGVEKLAIEYTRAFGAVSPSYGLPAPYESVHRQSDSPAEIRAAVGRFYLDVGLMPLDSAAPADHLGVELKFLSLLCHNEAEAWKNGRKEDGARLLRQSRTFLDEHLLPWAPQYLWMMRARTRHALYREVALLTMETATEHSESKHLSYAELEIDDAGTTEQELRSHGP